MLIHNLFHRSTYFHSVVPRLKSDPVIFLKGVKGAHLDKILKFIYSGKVALSRHQLKPILEVAKSLQVAGLCDANPTDILQQQQPSALGASRALQGNSGSGQPHRVGGLLAVGHTTGCVSRAIAHSARGMAKGHRPQTRSVVLPVLTA